MTALQNDSTSRREDGRWFSWCHVGQQHLDNEFVQSGFSKFEMQFELGVETLQRVVGV